MLSIQSEKRRRLALLLIISFANGLTLTCFRIAANSLCLSSPGGLGRSIYAIFFASATLPFAGCAYAWLIRRARPGRIVLLTFGLLNVAVVGLWLGTTMAGSTRLALVLVLASEYFRVFSGLAFWQLAIRTFSGRRAGGAFAQLGAAFSVAQVIGGAGSGVFTEMFPTEHLLLVSALIMPVGTMLTICFAREFQGDDQTDAAEPDTTTNGLHRDQGVMTSTFPVLVLVFSGLSVLGWQFVYHVFTYTASTYCSDAARLAQCLGTIDVVVGILQVFCMTFVSGRLIGSFGPRPGLIVVPSLLSVAVVAMWTGWGLFESLGPVFWIAVFAKLAGDVCRSSLQKPSVNLLYGMLSPATRNHLMTMVQTIVKPLAGAAAAGSLIFVNTVFDWSLVARIVLTLGTVVAWCGAAALLSIHCEHRCRSDGRRRAEPATTR